jgi:threonine dehydrogenase-like Zn-dependent dehydrogenase
MSSRNATKEDFEKVIEWLESGKVPVEKIITRELKSGDLINFFQNKLLKEYMNEIKIMIEL